MDWPVGFLSCKMLVRFFHLPLYFGFYFPCKHWVNLKRDKDFRKSLT